MDLSILEDIATHKTTALDAYIHDEVQRLDLKRARFVRFKLQSPEMPLFLNGVFRFISRIPLPLKMAQIGLKRIPHTQDGPWDSALIKHLLRYAKGTKIQVETDDATIAITVH